jgi:hypothetical protein
MDRDRQVPKTGKSCLRHVLRRSENRVLLRRGRKVKKNSADGLGLGQSGVSVTRSPRFRPSMGAEAVGLDGLAARPGGGGGVNVAVRADSQRKICAGMPVWFVLHPEPDTEPACPARHAGQSMLS